MGSVEIQDLLSALPNEFAWSTFTLLLVLFSQKAHKTKWVRNLIETYDKRSHLEDISLYLLIVLMHAPTYFVCVYIDKQGNIILWTEQGHTKT